MSEGITIIRNAGAPPEIETRGRKKGTYPPLKRPRRVYPWDKLRVGDAFDVPLRAIAVSEDRHPDYNAVTASISHRHKRHPERFVARIQDDFRVRVWRVA